jgi:hypothetical protein
MDPISKAKMDRFDAQPASVRKYQWGIGVFWKENGGRNTRAEMIRARKVAWRPAQVRPKEEWE